VTLTNDQGDPMLLFWPTFLLKLKSLRGNIQVHWPYAAPTRVWASPCATTTESE